MAKEEAFVRRGSLIHHPETELSGFTSGSFIRMVLLNNWYEKPYPRPLSHGSSVWPWNGYIKWYDDHTPNLSHFEVDVNNIGWKRCGEYWTWFLSFGQNILRVRSVNKFGVGGKPSVIVLNYYDVR